ncbi:DNA repair protein RadC [Ruminococcaceae bacterium OttesenSCG-928-O06]|nr:DNA repair protein RadC [Ruminococcaceae bacterium OttesenSCG-928-O06]
MSSLHDGHRKRLRARYLREGLSHFEEHTALELLLFYARPRCDTNELAHVLLKKFGSFAAVLEAPVEALMRVEGMGETSAVLLKLVPDLGAFYLNSRTAPGTVLDSTEKAGAYFLPKFFGKSNEQVYIAALDDKRKVIRCTLLSDEGIVNAVRITVKRIVTEAVHTNATGVILAHNHPGGIALPSTGDKQVTYQAYQALRLINVQLLDHIIVADEDFVSMADSGYIDMLRRDTIG